MARSLNSEEPFRTPEGATNSRLLGRCGFWNRSAPDAPEQNHADEDGNHTRGLCIRKAEKRSRIDANELNEEARDARQNQVTAKNFTLVPHAAQGPLSQPPEECSDRKPN